MFTQLVNRVEHLACTASRRYRAQMRRNDRFSEIMRTLTDSGAVDVAVLAARLDVSEATIRRDLQLLEAQHMLTRTHGGAIASGVTYELPLRYKAARFHDEKIRIAHEAAARVLDNAVVGLTGGTTTTEVARALLGRPELTVVTNAMNIAGELAIRSDLKLVVTGGTARPESYELVGPIAEAALEGMNLDLAIVGVDGITVREGLTTHHEVEARTNGTLLERARHVVAVADSSKLGLVAFARICPVTALDELITDVAAEPGAVTSLREAGVTVTVV